MLITGGELSAYNRSLAGYYNSLEMANMIVFAIDFYQHRPTALQLKFAIASHLRNTVHGSSQTLDDI